MNPQKDSLIWKKIQREAVKLGVSKSSCQRRLGLFHGVELGLPRRHQHTLPELPVGINFTTG